MSETNETMRRHAYDCGIAPDAELAFIHDADHLAAIDRQVLWRTEDMPEWGGLWVKDEMRRCYWWGVFCHTFCAAPDYRPDEEGPLFLPILDPPEGS